MLKFLRSKSPLEDGLQEVYDRLDKAYRQAKIISESSLDILKEMDEQYFKLMNGVIQHPWTFARNYRRIDPALKWKNSFTVIDASYRPIYSRTKVLSLEHGIVIPITECSLGSASSEVSSFKELVHSKINYCPVAKTRLDEKLSDHCMSELMGSPTQAPCSISRECVTVMSRRGMDGYGITHQLLYTMLAEQSRCLGILNSELSRLPSQLTVEKLQAEFCANNFFETSRSVMMQNKTIKFPLHDLFLEQELVCPMLGYVEFLHSDWLQQILSWQMPSGCYGENISNKKRHSRRVQRDSRTVRSSGVDFGQPTRVNHLAQPNKHLPVRPTLQGKPKSIGNDGVLTWVKPLTNIVPIPAGRIPREELVGLNSNARKSDYNDSKIRIGIPVVGTNPMYMERGKLGKHIKLNRHGGILEQAVGEHNQEQGRVGDTQMGMEESMGIQGFRRVGNFWKHFIPVTETGGGDNHPQLASDEENFRINRRINRKLLYDKDLKDGCSAHMTAVAMGALSQYLRFLIVANSSGFDATKCLFDINYLTHPDKLLTPRVPTDPSLEGVSSISSTYAFVIVITALILLVLCRLLWKHRIGIRYRHGLWK